MEAFGLDGGVDLFEGGLLGGVETVARADGGFQHDGFGLEGDDAFARERAGSGADVPDGVLELFQVVRAGVQFEEGTELPLGLVELAVFGRSRELDAEALREGAFAAGSRSVCTSSEAMKPFRSRERMALSASGMALAR